MPSPAELAALQKKYTKEKLAQVRKLFDRDVKWWSKIKRERDLDLQCISTMTSDPSVVAGPWPPAEWQARHAVGNERPCLHEDLLTPYINQVVNKIEMNPMGIEAQPAGDGSSEEAAEFVESRIRGIEYEENAQYAYQTAAKCAVEGSYGWWKAETRYSGKFRQKLCVVPVSDPNTIVPGFFKRPDAGDMRRCWEIERMTHEEYREKYPKAKIRSFDGLEYEDADQWYDEATVQVAAWWHLESDERELLAFDDGNGGTVDIYRDEMDEGAEIDESRVVRTRTVKRNRVVKTITNGIEALDETEWLDPGESEDTPPEIPIYGVFGRQKYQDGTLVIESLVRKGRVGQLLYDVCISNISEVIAMTPKAKMLGPEHAFDTSTNFRTWHRDPIAYAEYKVTLSERGEVLPPPEVINYEPPIQALEFAKESIIRSIQNAIGMSAVERKDKAAKSGKALDALMEEMTVGTSHYFGALRVAQERFYRMTVRVLPLIEPPDSEVSVRDKFGKHEVTQVPPDAYQGRYSVTVGTGKLYQSLQAKQEEFAHELLKVGGDPAVMLVALMSAAKMRGLGEYGDQIYDAFKAILSVQYPDVAKAMSNEDQQPMPPEAMHAIMEAQQSLQALNAHAKKLEEQVIELQDKIDAKVVESESRERISAEDNATKVQLEQMKIEAQFRLKELELEIEKVRASLAAQMKGRELETKERMQGSQFEHDDAAQDKQLIHEVLTAERSSDGEEKG